jgi:hypothetical protein
MVRRLKGLAAENLAKRWQAAISLGVIALAITIMIVYLFRSQNRAGKNDLPYKEHHD